MDRAITYPGSVPLDTDLLRTNKFAMMGLAKLAAAMLGTATIINGLACVPTAPAGLTVNVNPGEIYAMANVDGTAYSSIPADTTHSILKQGIVLDAVNLSCSPPGTVGLSINYLIQVTYQDLDTDLTALPYYNASNPSQAWSGPNNSGTAQATTRKGAIILAAKAGVAAATGTQTTPAADVGYTGLYVVTVANGQTQITAGNISQVAGAPIMPSSVLSAIQTGNLSYAVATGTANAHVVALTPKLTQRVDGMVIRYKAPAANTGALTLDDGLGPVTVVGGAHAALQGGETAPNGDVWVQWNSSIGGGSYVMIDSTGGALQVAPATKSQHAPQFGQLPAVVGSMRNAKMSVATASATATFTADEIVVESALGGLPYRLANFSQTINLGGVGAGGMDTGSAPVNGYVALYAIYNPITATQNILAVNATSAAAPNVYGGANMPAGYTASALIGVWPTNGSSQFKIGLQRDRKFSTSNTTLLSTSSTAGSATPLSISGFAPPNAVSVGGEITAASSAGAALTTIFVGADANMSGQMGVYSGSVAGAALLANYEVDVLTAQTIYYTATNSTGTPTFGIYASSYRF